jgi:hypothetical protein
MTLADLKRELTVGRKLTLISSFGKTVNFTREVVKIQSNGVYLKRPEGERNSFLDYPKASLMEMSISGFKIYNTGKRPMTDKEKAIKAGYEKIRNKEQERIDMLSDGSSSYYQQVKYYKDNNAIYLMGNKTERGLRFDHNTGLVYDESIKGDLILEYKFS